MFTANPAGKGPAYSIVIPPPNVTGSCTWAMPQQTPCRTSCAAIRRMLGYEVLWMPGNDHAGNRHPERGGAPAGQRGQEPPRLGREAFIERVWEWRAVYGGKISISSSAWAPPAIGAA